MVSSSKIYGSWNPGQIDNSDLVGESADELLKDMQEQYNYVAVPKAAWEKLYSWYGGGPVFRRSVIGQGRSEQAVIEMYPLRFEVG